MAIATLDQWGRRRFHSFRKGFGGITPPPSLFDVRRRQVIYADFFGDVYVAAVKLTELMAWR